MFEDILFYEEIGLPAQKRAKRLKTKITPEIETAPEQIMLGAVLFLV
ncbi:MULTISPECIES: hypothetical protein [Bacillus]|nr:MULTISPECIES: hypothetical protein [Bacillus]